VLVLELSGSLDYSNWMDLDVEIREAVRKGNTRFIFDLSRTTLVDSMGIGVFIRALESVRAKQGGGIALVNIPATLAQNFKQSGLTGALRSIPSIKDALDGLAPPDE